MSSETTDKKPHKFENGYCLKCGAISTLESILRGCPGTGTDPAQETNLANVHYEQDEEFGMPHRIVSTPNKEEEPLPCPHCGSTNLDVYCGNSEHRWVACDDCLADGPVIPITAERMSDLAQAIKAWNARPPRPWNIGAPEIIVPNLEAERDTSRGCKQDPGITINHQKVLAVLPCGQPPLTPGFVELLRQAQEIVESKYVFKKFIDGTPLENDIAVWMAEFAQAALALTTKKEEKA